MRPPLIAAACVLAVATSAAGVIPEQAPDLPFFGPETQRGHITVAPAAAIAPSNKTVDGELSDWIGTPTRLGGTAIYSAGEYVYQDYLSDDHGADDGRDAERLRTLDPLRETEPRTYRLEVVAQVAGDEFELEGPPLVSAKVRYGDADVPARVAHQADIEETRIAADRDRLLFLVRTTGMTVEPGTVVLLLLDTEPGGTYPAPGAISTGAEWTFLAAGDRMLAASYRGTPVSCTASCPWQVATNPSAFVNAVEIGIARPLLEPLPASVGVAIATGVVDEAGAALADISTGEAEADLINVAFRFDEPVRIRMDRDQAVALLGGSIDGFLRRIDLAALATGYTESFRPGPGYYDRIYVSRSPVVREDHSGGEYQGTFQHYGVYIPTSYTPASRSPATVWLHPRSSGNAHLAASWVPGIIRQLGERRGNIIISPSARGSSTWWTGRGHEDFLEAWSDAMESFAIDPDRVYVSGHSMGGFGSYLVGLLYPDRFAAAFPISGPPTPGGWLGVGAPFDPQNDADVEAELMFNIVENARNLPYVIYQGTNDELVLAPGVVRMASRFTELGYRNRLYLFPGQDHYSPLLLDEYAAAARYLDRFRRDPNPARVTYKVWPALERAVETVSTPSGVTLDYAFDGAYWVGGLAIRSGDAADPATAGVFDGITFGRGVPEIVGVPEAGVVAPGQSAPFLMQGLRWLYTGRFAASNAATLTLTNIATAQLDVIRMGLSPAAPLTLSVETDGPVTLRLAATWTTAPTVTGASSSSYAAGLLTIAVAGGAHTITITP